MIRTPVGTLLRNSPPTISPSASAAGAAQRLRDPQTAALVVVDGDSVVGIVTESDLVALVAEERTALSVEAFMSTPPVTTTPETTVDAAADRMREAGVKHLPVVEDGACCGLVSVTDLAPYVSRRRLGIAWQGEPFTPPKAPGPRVAD